MDEKLENLLKKELSGDFPASLDEEKLHRVVGEKVRELIERDFRQLVNILYQIDVNEQRLKRLLKENEGKDTAAIIAALIIERQREKIKSRREAKHFDNPNDTEEKW